MKKIIFALATISLINYSAFAQSDDDKKQENKKQLQESMIKDLTEMGLPEEQATPLADCLSTKMVDNLSDKEVEEALKVDENNPGSDELNQKVQKYAEECFAEME